MIQIQKGVFPQMAKKYNLALNPPKKKTELTKDSMLAFMKDKTAEELFTQDFKAFQVDDIGIGVSQISSINQQELDKVATILDEYITTNLPSMETQLVYVMLTNIHEQCSDLLAFGPNAEKYASEAFHVTAENNICHLPGVVSRKKQVIPALAAKMQEEL